jgi:hypothetical protein
MEEKEKSEKRKGKRKKAEVEDEETDGRDLPDVFEMIREVGGRDWILNNIKALPKGSKDAMMFVKQYFDLKAITAQTRRQAATGGAERRIDELVTKLTSGVEQDGEDSAGEVGEESTDKPAGESPVPPERPDKPEWI